MATPTETHLTNQAVSVAQARSVYGRITRRKTLMLVALALTLFVTLTLDIAIGPADLSVMDVLTAIVAPNSISAANQVIMWDIRMPMALMAAVVGASLAVAGAEMQ
ncbi:iron chelate uptake ABC transporter family permease subunit, partial [Nitrolancea hollandica]|uniref:iron chelate uptake ABC transporter family permease subunit n=1 Tax=Nitrolancea hollandica TaxID=1206749 RepID=UPI00058B0216